MNVYVLAITMAASDQDDVVCEHRKEANAIIEELREATAIAIRICNEVFSNRQLFSTIKYVTINILLTLFLWDFVYERETDNRFYGKFYLDQKLNYSTGNDYFDGLVNGFATVTFLAAVSFLMLGIALLDLQKLVQLWLHASSILILYVISGLTFHDFVRKLDTFLSLEQSDFVLNFVVGFVTALYGTLGVYAFFFDGSLALHQCYVITNCSFVAVFYLRAFPNHTAWFVLWSVVAWDIFAVTASMGPLKKIQEKAADYNSTVLRFLMFSAQEEEQTEQDAPEPSEDSDDEFADASDRLLAGVDKSKFSGKNVKNLLRFFIDKQRRLDEKIKNKLEEQGNDSKSEVDLSWMSKLPKRKDLAVLRPYGESSDDDVSPRVSFVNDPVRETQSKESIISEKLRERRKSINGTSSSDPEDVEEVPYEPEEELLSEVKTANSISNISQIGEEIDDETEQAEVEPQVEKVENFEQAEEAEVKPHFEKAAEDGVVQQVEKVEDVHDAEKSNGANEEVEDVEQIEDAIESTEFEKSEEVKTFYSSDEDSEPSLEIDQLLEVKRVVANYNAEKARKAVERKPEANLTAADALQGDAMRLGMGDFVFYSVLVGKAACYGSFFVTFVTLFGVLFGLAMTLTVLSSDDETTPALPVPVASGTAFYFYAMGIQAVFNKYLVPLLGDDFRLDAKEL